MTSEWELSLEQPTADMFARILANQLRGGGQARNDSICVVSKDRILYNPLFMEYLYGMRWYGVLLPPQKTKTQAFAFAMGFDSLVRTPGGLDFHHSKSNPLKGKELSRSSREVFERGVNLAKEIQDQIDKIEQEDGMILGRKLLPALRNIEGVDICVLGA